MGFDIDITKQDSPGDWFQFPGGGRVQLRALGFDDWKQIRKASVRREPAFPLIDGKHVRLDAEVIDQDLQWEMILERTIVNWEGFHDRNGAEIPCNNKMRVALMTMKDQSFRAFYETTMAALNETEGQRRDDLEKN